MNFQTSINNTVPRNPPVCSTSIVDVSNFCDKCSFEAASRQEWLIHLCSEDHQSFFRIPEPRKDWPLERSLCIYDCQGVTSMSILTFLESWGFVENYLYSCKKDGHADNCFALMQEKRVANVITAGCGPRNHTFPDGKVIKIKKVVPDHLNKNKKQKKNIVQRGPSNTAGGFFQRDPRYFWQSNGPPVHACKMCSVNLWGDDDWVEHLCNNIHSSNVKTNLGQLTRDLDPSRTIRIKGAKNMSTKLIVKFGMSQGKVVDVIHHAQDFAFLQFEDKKTVESILNFEYYHYFEWQKIVVEPLPPFTGLSKKERQLKKAEQLTQELAKGVKQEGPYRKYFYNKNGANAESKAIRSSLEGKELEEQLQILLERISLPEGVYLEADHFIREVLTPAVKRLPAPFNSMRLERCGSTAIRTWAKGYGRVPRIELTFDLRSLGINLQKVEFQAELVHMLKEEIHKFNLQIPPESLKAQPTPTALNIRPELSFSIPPNHFYYLRLSEDHLLAVQETSLIAHYCYLDPRISPLIKIVVERMDLWNYFRTPEQFFQDQLISFLVIFYLQYKKLIPTVHELKSGACKTEPIWIQGFDCSFSPLGKPNPDILSLSKDPSLFALSVTGILKGFFQFYGWLDQNTVLCLRLGQLIPKEDFLPEKLENLPEQIVKLYKARMSSRSFTTTGYVNIQDPFVLNLNLTDFHLGGKSFARFRGYCRKSFKFLETSFEQEKPDLSAIFVAFAKVKEEEDDMNSEEDTGEKIAEQSNDVKPILEMITIKSEAEPDEG